MRSQLTLNVLLVPSGWLLFGVDVLGEANDELKVREVEFVIDPLQGFAQIEPDRTISILEGDVKMEFEVVSKFHEGLASELLGLLRLEDIPHEEHGNEVEEDKDAGAGTEREVKT